MVFNYVIFEQPECKVADEMRFTAYNQYVHKMLHRWGPNVKEMMAIKKFLSTQKISLTQAPLVSRVFCALPTSMQPVVICIASFVTRLAVWKSIYHDFTKSYSNVAD